MQEKHFIPGLTETVQDRYERNRVVIEDFHKNEGRVGGNFAKLGHTFANAYRRKDRPEAGEPNALYAGGKPHDCVRGVSRLAKNPDWVYNLKANPIAKVEVGTDGFEVKAKLLTGEEREKIWATWKEARLSYVDMEKKASRVIPVFALEPTGKR